MIHSFAGAGRKIPRDAPRSEAAQQGAHSYQERASRSATEVFHVRLIASDPRIHLFSTAGRRERFPLYTPNKAAAASKARDLYVFLATNGWEATLARYRKPKAVVHEHNGDQPVSVGAFL